MLYIYATMIILAFTTLLFWAKWSNKKTELKTAKENHTKSELQKTSEIKRFNKFYEYVKQLNKFGDTNNPDNIKDLPGPLVVQLKKIYDTCATVTNLENAINVIRTKLGGYYPGTDRINIQTLIDQLIKEATDSVEKDKKIEKLQKSLHVAHQKKYEYRKRLIKAGLLKPRAKKKK